LADCGAASLQSLSRRLPIAVSCALEAAACLGLDHRFELAFGVDRLILNHGSRQLAIALGQRAMYPGTPETVRQLCSDKSAVSRLLARRGLPVVPILAEELEEAVTLLGALRQRPFFLKGNHGHCGRQCFAARDGPDLVAAMAQLPWTQDGVLVQPFIEAMEGRVIALHGQVLGGYLRTGPLLRGDGHSTLWELWQQVRPGSASRAFAAWWLSLQGESLDALSCQDGSIELPGPRNLAQGGRAARPLSRLEIRPLLPLLRAVHHVLPAPVLGVDVFLPVGGRPMVIDVNTSPDLAGLVYTGQGQLAVDLWLHILREEFAQAPRIESRATRSLQCV
jgi:RimK-like ATP-grasp domain